MRAVGREWVGGCFVLPGYVLEGGPYRPAVWLWLELPEGLVVGSQVVDPREALPFAETFRATMAHPMVGAPRSPRRVRLADPALAAELHAAHPEIEVVVAPTPELDSLLEAMTSALPHDTEEDTYLAGGVPADAVATLFGNAKLVWTIAPWKLADDCHVLRVDMPALAVEGACLSIIGALGESLGFLLFPSLAGYEAFIEAGERRPSPVIDLDTTILSLTFSRGADLPPVLRREIAEHGWPVAAPDAYPRVEHRDRDGVLRPLTEHDVRVVAAVAASLAAFFVKHGDALRRESFEPLCESWYDANDLEIRFTAPYEAYPLFTIAAPPTRPGAITTPQAITTPRVGRNAPCPCGSGRKYKKCCLARDAASARPAAPALDDVEDRALIHAIDERLVAEMCHYAERRFGKAWRRSRADFTDPEMAFQFAVPWSVYGFRVAGRTVAAAFLAEPSRPLAPAERRWLEAQGRAWLGIWEVTTVDPGNSVTVEDLLSGETRIVREVSGSKTLVVRDTVMGRVVDHQGVSVFCGMHPRPLPPLDAAAVVRRARAKLRARGDIAVEHLRDDSFGRSLIRQWERAVAELDRRSQTPPILHNTDGDAVLLTTDHFTFETVDRPAVVARLRAIGGIAPPDAEAAVLDEQRGATSFTFLAPGNAMHASWENTVVGIARVGAATLEIESNSVRRADDLRGRVESACDALVRHRCREHVDPRAHVMKHPPPERASSGAGPDHGAVFPEAAGLVRAYKERHYADWLDLPIPALADKTPLAAVRTKRGREQVDTLLKQMEHHEARLPPDERFDFAAMRAKLGLGRRFP